jgi:hypothetical protein
MAQSDIIRVIRIKACADSLNKVRGSCEVTMLILVDEPGIHPALNDASICLKRRQGAAGIQVGFQHPRSSSIGASDGSARLGD